jgi:DNA-directed RNA polymerase specialized sigma subunit
LYEWLSKYQEWEQKIALLDWELETYKEELRRWKNPDDLGRYSLVKESKASKLEDIIDNLEYELAVQMNYRYDLRKVIYSFKGIEQHILRMKYVEGLTLKEIASELGYAYEYIRKKHSMILKTVEFKKKYVIPLKGHN